MKKCCWLYANEKINTYAACFIGKTITELVDDFNQEVGVTELTQDRAYYREALLHALEEKGIDVSTVMDGMNIRFDHRIHFDWETNSLVKEE